MADEKNVEIDMGENNSITEMDSIYVSTEVIRKIVGMTVNRVDGVSGMSAGLVGGIAERLGQRDLSKGIKVQQFDNQISIDINVIVEYGVKIPEVAEKLQRFYLSRPDSMTDTVVNIDGTPYPEEIMHPLGLLSTAAAISIARPVNSDSKELIKRFMEAEMRTDKRRYYDNCLYFFSLLALSGRYRVIWPRV